MNFTWRARSLLALASLALAVGLLFRQEPLAYAGLTVVLWIGLEWANFRWRTLSVREAFIARRVIAGQSRGSHALVIDQDAEVCLEVKVARRLSGLRVWLEDAVPHGFSLVEGSPAMVADLAGAETLAWSYTLRPTATRRTGLPGLQAAISDPQGLFRLQRFVPLRQDVTVLPFMVRPQATVSVLKRQNVQLLPGKHRFRRPGLSTELLGIRDYQRGDPPRSIAWKATARLDKLMTCEYESEAPIRSTILADLSPVQFLGRPGAARADRIISACASLARLLLSEGDPLAGLVISRSEQTWLPHGLGERQLSRWLLRLLSYTEPLSLDTLEVNDVTRLAWTCGYRRFPELFDDEINYARASSFVFGGRRYLVRQRQQLGLALAHLYGGDAALPVRLVFDDRLYRDYCRRLIEDHPGMVDVAGLYVRPAQARGDEPTTIAALCRGLISGAAHASDNELFAIVAAAPREPQHLEQFVEAVRVARAAHHRVLMIDVGSEISAEQFGDPVARQTLIDSQRRQETERFADLERRLTRLGAKLARLDDARLMEKAAAEVEILRSGRARSPVRGAL